MGGDPQGPHRTDPANPARRSIFLRFANRGCRWPYRPSSRDLRRGGCLPLGSNRSRQYVLQLSFEAVQIRGRHHLCCCPKQHLSQLYPVRIKTADHDAGEDPFLGERIDDRRGGTRKPQRNLVEEGPVEKLNIRYPLKALSEPHGRGVVQTSEPGQSGLAEQPKMDRKSERA